MKVVINECYGGYSISKECAEFMANLGNKKAKAELDDWEKRQSCLNYYKKNGCFPNNCDNDIKNSINIDAEYGYYDAIFYGNNEYERTDKDLIKAIETLGEEASGCFSNLKVIEVPDNKKWSIIEHDGYEIICTLHGDSK